VLLAPDDPAPFEVVPATPRSRYVITCDHASRRIPRALGTLGLPEHELERHIAWDIGVAELGRKLAAALDATLILQGYSRLVIDCNRPLDRPDSIATSSEDTPIPGNVDISPASARARAAEIFEPYHARIQRELDERRARSQTTLLVLLHSFTPVYRAVGRAWHAGVLHLRDTRLASPVLRALRAEPGLVVGDNEPYAASDLTDYGIVEHGEKRGLLHVELEVRQDLIADDAGTSAWAERLARVLEAARGEAEQS
jgi:predicted N-formylglutamate amidohydrolase